MLGLIVTLNMLSLLHWYHRDIYSNVRLLLNEQLPRKRFAGIFLANMPDPLSSSGVATSKMEQRNYPSPNIVPRWDLRSGTSYRPCARVQGIEAKSRVLERAQSPSWIFGLRRADVARARSSQCCFCGTTRVTIGHCRRRERKKEREPVTTC